MLTLLAQVDIGEWLLDILEVEDDTVALGKHLMDQISFQAYDVLLVARRKLILKFVLWHDIVVVSKLDVVLDLIMDLVEGAHI